MAVKDRLLDVFLSEEGVTSVDEEITQLRGMGIDEAESKGAQTSYHVELLRRYLELLKRDREHLLDPGSGARFGDCSTGLAPRSTPTPCS